MAMKQCRECGVEVSDAAEVCPQCGIKHPARKLPYAGNIMFVSALVAIVFLANNYGLIGSEQSSSGIPASPSVTDAERLRHVAVSACISAIRNALKDPKPEIPDIYFGQGISYKNSSNAVSVAIDFSPHNGFNALLKQRGVCRWRIEKDGVSLKPTSFKIGAPED